MRRAVGDATGLTIKAQVRQAARNLDFPAESWRPREAFYGRAGGWSAAALDDLRRRFAAWREHEDERATPDSARLEQRVAAVRWRLARLKAEVEAIESEVDRMLVDGGQPNGGGSASDA